MKKQIAKIIAIVMALCMLFSLTACNNAATANIVLNKNENPENVVVEDEDVVVNPSVPSLDDVYVPNLVEPIPSTNDETTNLSPNGEYNKGVVLVKVKKSFNKKDLGKLSYTSADPIYKGSKWYSVKLTDAEKTEEAANYLFGLNSFESVDYDYVMKVDADVQSVDISGNTYAENLTYLETLGVKKGWESNLQNGKTPGGSPDVIIAVIDTGVDYNHLDLRNNIWVNTAEIPDNGKDDDGNGYIDDINGWDCVGNDNNPMDDNGHGTHVAGIAAAANNKLGTVGVAYNCKIMVLKAGNSSGYFNNSDIAEAVQYAYMNGASVINMSFGGYSISTAVEDALKDAYNTCVLVAAAGNDGICNQPNCSTHMLNCKPAYPASLQYVIGVMSCNSNGTSLSSFSNFDHFPFNNYEYDVVACGENIQSTWPNNKYASLSGTSMACPTVAGIAAVVRSTYSDREKYSTKYITSQIVNTVSRKNNLGIANLEAALTELPKPYIYNIYDQYIFDNVEFSPKNNGNGVIDAGETIRLAIELQNRGGAATDVVAKIDTIRSEDTDLTDPYFTIVKDTISFSDIGTYSVRDCGKIYNSEGKWIATEKYFEIIVSENCPNSYLVNFNINLTYKNGLDDADKTVYDGKGSVLCNVNRGYYLSGSIDEDTIFEADRLYIISSDVVIPEGITVTFKEGCQIQFYDNREYYNSPQIIVYGMLNFEGTKEKMICIFPDENHTEFQCIIKNLGSVNFYYTDAVNLSINDGSDSYIKTPTYAENSYFRTEPFAYIRKYKNGGISGTAGSLFFFVETIKNSYLNFYYSNVSVVVDDLNNTNVIGNSKSLSMHITNSATNNIIYTHCYTGSVHSSREFEFGAYKTVAVVKNNIFASENKEVSALALHNVNGNSGAGVIYENNEFSEGYQKYASQVFSGYYDASGNPTVDVYGSLSDPSALWPYVVDVEMFNKDGETVNTVGNEEIKVRVTFNRPMDTTKDTYLTFGTVEPYADYKINGNWISDTVWEGTYTLKAQIENGQNFLKVNNACAAEDPTKTVFGEYQLHEFTIDTTAALSMNLQAFPKENGIELTFVQDDYDTLLGYNVYRSEDKDGNFVKLNPTIVLADDGAFLDENAEPGKTYWYTYTVVLSDFTESNPAGKVMATAMDTMSPTLYHTPVNQGYENNNLVITATATDNVAISKVTLYYRIKGNDNWKSLLMVKQNDKFSATIFGSEVTLEGLEYYIVATDGINEVQKGSADVPYTIIVKSADSLLGLGDVDGNGTVTVKDALMLMQCLNGELLLSDDAFKRADLDGSGKLSSAEALRILQYVNGKVSNLDM